MKNLYAFVGLLLVCCGIISSCKTLFDVAPKGIYSPIELNKETTAVTYTKDSILIVNDKGELKPSLVENSTVKLTVKEGSLYYGAVLFYDSPNAVELIKTNRFIGVHELYFQDQKKGSSGLNRTIKVRIDPSKGQSQYIVPVAYNISDSSIIYNAQGLIRTIISPWSHFADIIPPAPSDFIQIFQGADKLSYITSVSSLTNPAISCREYNEKEHKWGAVGSIPSSSTYVAVDRYGPILDNNGNTTIGKSVITPTSWIFYQNNTYYMVASIYSGISYTGGYVYSIVALDSKFSSYSLVNIFNYQQEGFGPILSAISKQDTIQIFYNEHNFGQSTSGFGSNYTSVSTYLTSKNLTVNPATSYIKAYSNSIALNLNNQFIINDGADQTKFTTYNVTKNTIVDPISSIISSANLYGSIKSPSDRGQYISLSNGSESFVISRNQIIYKVTLKNRLVNFQTIYSKWFPANGPASISQGIMYKGKLAFLLNNYEVWLFDPMNISIDFIRNPPTIVPL